MAAGSRDRGLRPRERRKPRADPSAQAAPAPSRDRPPLRAAAGKGTDARPDTALLQRGPGQGRARARARQGRARQASHGGRARGEARHRARTQVASVKFLRHALMDIAPLRRHREFRLLIAGRSASFLGTMVTFVALPYQVYKLTGSSFAVGLLGLAELGPLLVMPFVGGALADAVSRRRMLQLTELGLCGMSALLLVNAELDKPRLWLIFVVAAAIAGIEGLQRPSLDALEPRLVDRDELPAANAISAFVATAGMIGGPALGGILIATVGLPSTFVFDIATFGVSLVALAAMRAVPPPPDAQRPSLRSIAEGFRYARSRPELLGTYGVDIIAMFFGMPNALFPALAVKLGGGPGILGLIYAAPSVGSLLATVTSGWVARVHRHGVAVCVAAAGWGVGIVVLGLAPGLALPPGGPARGRP